MRKWVLPFVLAVLFFAVAEGTGEVSMMRDATYSVSNDGVNWRSPTTSDFAEGFISTMIKAFIFGPVMVIPVVFSTRYVMRRMNASSRVGAVAVTATCGAIVGVMASFLVFLVVGGWGPPQLLGLLASGIGAAIGWGVVSGRRRLA
jgi:hypothetical protein